MEDMTRQSTKEAEAETKQSADRVLPFCAVSMGSGLAQGVCVLLMAANSIKALLGISSAAVAGGSSWLHADAVRIPLMIIAGVTATFTIYTIWNGWRLRNSPSARWRKRPLSRKEKVSIAAGLFFSILSLLLVVGELVAHRILHGG